MIMSVCHRACVPQCRGFAAGIFYRSKLQINKQHQKCLLALIPIQNNICDRGETILFSYL